MFLAVDVAMLRHPKTMRLRRLLQDSRAALYVIELWAWCSEYAKDGDLTDFAAEEIEGGIGWTLDAGKLYAALRDAGFIDFTEDGRVLVHDWDNHQGKWIAKMEAERTRLKDWRAGRRKSDKPEPHPAQELVETVITDGVQPELPLRTSTVRVREQYATPNVRDNLTKPNLTKPKNGSCGEVAEPPAPPSPVLLVFPTVPGKKDGATSWGMTQAHVDLIAQGYPDLDVAQEAREALVWCHANKAERKTADGMLSFLQRWMKKSQNSRASKPQWLLDKERKERAIAQSEANRRLAASEAAKRQAGERTMCGFHMYSGEDKRFTAADCNRRCPRYEPVAIGGIT